MRTSLLTFTPGQTIHIEALGEYFEILESVAGVDIAFYKNGSYHSSAQNMGYGFYQRPKNGFDAIDITSATGQTIKISFGNGDGGYNRTSGNFQEIGQQSAFTQAQATVTSASAQLLAANAARRFLYIENNDASGNVYVTMDGTPATAGKGKKLRPNGGFILLDKIVPSGQINAIGDIASNANVVIMEG